MAIDYSGVENTYNQAAQANTELANLTSAGGNLETMLRDTLSQRFSGSPLSSARESAAQTAMNSPSDIRAFMAEKVKTNPLSPTQQQQVSTQMQSANVAPLITLNDLLGIRTGSINDVLSGGINAYNSMVNAKQIQAQGLRQSATDQLNLLLQKSQEDRANATASSSSDWLSGLIGQNATPTEPKPVYSPSKIGESSQGGQWQFTGKDWEPVASAGGGNLSALTPEALASGVLSGNLNAASAALLGKLSGAIPTASAEKTKVENKKFENVVNSLSNLKTMVTGNVLSFNLGDQKSYDVTQKMVGQFLARLVESGRLSDQDRIYYLSLLPGYTLSKIAPKLAKKNIDSVISAIQAQMNNPAIETYSSDEWDVVQ